MGNGVAAPVSSMCSGRWVLVTGGAGNNGAHPRH
jgi:hypothetical protein